MIIVLRNVFKAWNVTGIKRHHDSHHIWLQATAAAISGEEKDEKSKCHAELLSRDLITERIRVRELEHECRTLKRNSEEVRVLQSQIDQMATECTEWQQRYMCAVSSATAPVLSTISFQACLLCEVLSGVQGCKARIAAIIS